MELNPTGGNRIRGGGGNPPFRKKARNSGRGQSGARAWKSGIHQGIGRDLGQGGDAASPGSSGPPFNLMAS